MWHWLRWVLLAIGILVGGFFILSNAPWVFLPHKHISIILPFPAEFDETTSLIPMGEKFEHPDGDGHPGIDFGFQKVTPVIAVADGRIGFIYKNNEGSSDVEIFHGFYKSVYKELNYLESGIKFGKSIKQGEVIGHTGFEGDREQKFLPGGPSGQVHWEFSSVSMAIDRLCPLGYFTSASRQRIEHIWATVPENDIFKQSYPDICSGAFKAKED